MKLLLENWREFVKQEIEEFLPHGEVRAVERIGSSTLSPEDKVEQDLEKYGYARDDDERDFDIEVQIAGVSNEDVEEWAFSEEAEELESSYNYDIQLTIVENWRRFINEEVITSTEVSLYLAPSPIHGQGVFTGKHMPEGTDLGIAHIKQPEGHDVTPLGKYHNHSATPNCANVSKGDKRHLVALRDIGPEEEITVDYTLQPDLEQPGDSWL